MNLIMIKRLSAWGVHLLTASGAIIALFTLNEIVNQRYISALWLMGLAIFVDAIDGTLARLVDIKKTVPQIDGALLDNIIDFLNYVITPCFFIWMAPDLLSAAVKPWLISIICLASCYQFTQNDAKTADHFFKGFPCYWNLVVMYLYLFSVSSHLSTFILFALSILVFIPIKYVYPTRLDYLTTISWLKKLMLFASIGYGASCLMMLYCYPVIPVALVTYSVIYVIFYLSFSVLRTIAPIIKAKRA